MTEDEWNDCTEPVRMLEFLRGTRQASDRKFRLFSVAYSRCVWERLTDPRTRQLVGVTERYADAEASLAELLDARAAAQDAPPADPEAACACDAAYPSAIQEVVAASTEWYSHQVPAAERQWVGVVQGELLRDLFHPFRPVALHPSWRTPAVTTLAQAIYEQRAFDRMPELATALAVAGCTEAELLGHLRGVGPHVRGCWALDLLLGKA
jgi:hypothetical protein